MTPYGNIDWSQHWLKLWLFAWQYQAITWPNVDLSTLLFCGIHLRVIPQEERMTVIYNMSSGITLLKLLTHLHGVNELIIGTVYNWVTMAPKIIKYLFPRQNGCQCGMTPVCPMFNSLWSSNTIYGDLELGEHWFR